MLSGDNSILSRATDAKTNTDNSQIQERINLAYHSSLVDGQGKVTETSLENELKKEFNKTTLGEGWLDKTSVEGKWRITIDEISLDVPAGVESAQTYIILPNNNYQFGVFDEIKVSLNDYVGMTWYDFAMNNNTSYEIVNGSHRFDLKDMILNSYDLEDENAGLIKKSFGSSIYCISNDEMIDWGTEYCSSKILEGEVYYIKNYS